MNLFMIMQYKYKQLQQSKKSMIQNFPQQSNKIKNKKSKVQSIQFDILLTTDSKQQQKKIINDQIKPIGFKDKQQLQLKFASATKERYTDDSQGLKLLLIDIEKINLLMKQSQVTSPIACQINSVFINYLGNAQQHNFITKAELINLWLVIPYQIFQTFITKLNLKEEFRTQNQLKISQSLSRLIQNSKLLQCCVYYMFVTPIPEFQDKILVPKLVASDQIYNPIIIELLRRVPQLKMKVVGLITPAKAVIIIQHLQENPLDYPKIYQFLLRKCYNSAVHQYTSWQVFEDKMSFNQTFIKWYCDEQELPADVKESIRFRNGLGGKQERVINPLFSHDGFKPTEEILSEYKICQKIENNLKYIHLSQYGIQQKDVYFITDSTLPIFDQMVNDVLTSNCIGIDVQYRCSSTKYEQLGASLIQISTNKQVYLIDVISLELNNIFLDFFDRFLKNPSIQKIGHSLQSDIKIIQRTMKIENKEGIVDIAKIFKQKYSNQTQSSLAFMSSYLIGKQLSKFQQRSNWNRRPIKKSQIHYAALDAQICLVLFYIMKQRDISEIEITTSNKKIAEMKVIRKGNVVFKEGQEEMLKRDTPKFIVDSMLKKLCSLLRNLGIDAEYMSVSNYDALQQIAIKQNRVILTRNKKLLQKKNPLMPIYCIEEKGDSDLMLQEIKKQFKLDFSKFKTLSRCVKCNCPELEVINREEAFKYIKFQYQDNQIEEFWKCQKCKQIYWEGNQFKNAKKRFENV